MTDVERLRCRGRCVRLSTGMLIAVAGLALAGCTEGSSESTSSSTPVSTTAAPPTSATAAPSSTGDTPSGTNSAPAGPTEQLPRPNAKHLMSMLTTAGVDQLAEPERGFDDANVSGSWRGRVINVHLYPASFELNLDKGTSATVAGIAGNRIAPSRGEGLLFECAAFSYQIYSYPRLAGRIDTNIDPDAGPSSYADAETFAAVLLPLTECTG